VAPFGDAPPPIIINEAIGICVHDFFASQHRELCKPHLYSAIRLQARFATHNSASLAGSIAMFRERRRPEAVGGVCSEIDDRRFNAKIAKRKSAFAASGIASAIVFARGRFERGLQHEVATGLDNQASQPPGGVGTGVDIDPVGAEIGRTYWTMPVDHDLGEIVFAKQEVFADPQQVFVPLVLQWYSRPDSGVDEQEITAFETWREITQELSM
jgi:hypothetical protein